MKVLCFGANGQVGNALSKIATGVQLISLDRAAADFSDPESLPELLDKHRPDAIINAAAYTAVDRAEEEEELAHLINGQAVEYLAQACKNRNLPLVHISTDYVFSGTGTTPYQPDDPVAPCNTYGRSKRNGEAALISSGVSGVILRTSWVFSAHGNNFVKTMIRLAETHNELNIVGDQHGGPTSARSIASACLHIAKQLQNTPQVPEIYHFSGTPDTTWAEFAQEIFRQWHDRTGKKHSIHQADTNLGISNTCGSTCQLASQLSFA